MVSFYDITVGQQVEFQRVLASAGFTGAHVERIIKEPSLASAMLASIQPAKAWTPPSWWRDPEQQLARAGKLWPGLTLPEPPKEFVPRVETEVLLLHVPDTFDALWEKVAAPTGYTKWRWEGVKADKRNLRLAPNKDEFTEPVWLGFDPEHGKGERPDSFWGRSDLAASEVLSVLIQFPDWPLAWFAGGSAPNLAGYQLKSDRAWSGVPGLFRWGDGRQLRLSGHWADRASGCWWSSPVVRELLES